MVICSNCGELLPDIYPESEILKQLENIWYKNLICLNCGEHQKFTGEEIEDKIINEKNIICIKCGHEVTVSEALNGFYNNKKY